MTLSNLPAGFWLSAALLIGLVMYGWSARHQGWGIPLIAVCGTVALWYLGDAIYNDYDKNHAIIFRSEIRSAAWYQVQLFLLALAFGAPLTHRIINERLLSRSSSVCELMASPRAIVRLQLPLTQIFVLLTTVWLTLSGVALILTDFDFKGLFFPYLGGKAYPWARARIGTGFDFLFSLANYVNLFCLAGFGVAAALTMSPKIRTQAIILIILSWPFVLVDRTRSTMLAVVLPMVLAIVFVRLRGRTWVQIGLLLTSFLVIEAWFGFVLANRSNASIGQALQYGGRDLSENEKHLGLNMLEELCWINQFIEDGSYEPNGGQRYFAEFVNPIPRTIWPGKPTIGLDYAEARGQGGSSSEDGGVFATISTGMIGQGVVNFGRILGPIAAAFLLSIWIAILARFDLTGERLGRLPLYVIGLVLTLNLGRDVTLLVAYPLLFGYILVRLWEFYKGGQLSATPGSGPGQISPR